jgi:hypothetical protein
MRYQIDYTLHTKFEPTWTVEFQTKKEVQNLFNQICESIPTEHREPLKNLYPYIATADMRVWDNKKNECIMQQSFVEGADRFDPTNWGLI